MESDYILKNFSSRGCYDNTQNRAKIRNSIEDKDQHYQCQTLSILFFLQDYDY